MLSGNKNLGRDSITSLGDIELHMPHYRGSQDEIWRQWNRRVARIYWDRVLIEFNDQNGCTKSDSKAYLELPFEN